MEDLIQCLNCGSSGKSSPVVPVMLFLKRSHKNTDVTVKFKLFSITFCTSRSFLVSLSPLVRRVDRNSLVVLLREEPVTAMEMPILGNV